MKIIFFNMIFTSFYAIFEKIAMKEVRLLTLVGHADIPDGQYAFMPLYCDDKKCDCRRAIIHVNQVSPEHRPFQSATISFGWESFDFYRRWSHHMPDDMVSEFKGPALDKMGPQSPYSEAMLKYFIKNTLDEAYIERLKRQYAMFKYKKGMKLPPDVAKYLSLYGPCPCGSGNNFKLCCGKTGLLSRKFK